MLSMLSGTHNSCHKGGRKGGPGRFFGVKVNPSSRRQLRWNAGMLEGWEAGRQYSVLA